MTQLKHCFTLR